MAVLDAPGIISDITSLSASTAAGGKIAGILGLSATPKVSENHPTCNNKGITDSGIKAAARIKAIIDGSILAYNTYNSLRMAKLQRDLGEKYLELAEEHRNYYNEQYKPLEVSLAKEALELPLYERNKDSLFAGQMLITARAQNAGKVDSAMTCTGRYCTGQRAAMMQNMLLEQAAVESTVAGLAHRYADKEEIAHNALRWEKRSQVLKIGRDIPTEAVSYANLATGIFGSLGKQAGLAAEGAISFLAYKRNDTQYPDRRGEMTVSEYKWKPTALETFKPRPTDTYEPSKQNEQVIRLSG